jgi:cytochrome P450
MTDERTQETPKPVPTGVELTALDPVFRADPYPVLTHLRGREPVHYDQVIHRWVLTRAQDIERVLRDRGMSVDPHKANDGTYMSIFQRFGTFSMLFQDPPAHTRLRGLVSKAFTTRAVERLAPRIRQIIDELLDAVAGHQRFDVIEALAGPLPVIVIAEMLGVDPADRHDFKRWSDAEALGLNPLLTAEELAMTGALNAELGAYLERTIAARRVDPHDDLISDLIAVEEAGDRHVRAAPRRRQRHHDRSDRQRDLAPAPASGGAPEAPRRPLPDHERRRGDPALRISGGADRAYRNGRDRDRRLSHSSRGVGAHLSRRRQSRTRGVPGA